MIQTVSNKLNVPVFTEQELSGSPFHCESGERVSRPHHRQQSATNTTTITAVECAQSNRFLAARERTYHPGHRVTFLDPLSRS